MLLLRRKPGERIVIDLAEDVDPRTPVGELFADGPIQLLVLSARGARVSFGIRADPRMRILREELCGNAVNTGRSDEE